MFPTLSRRIAMMYKWLGLVSIPLLTLVTIVSISNVFTRGQLASDPHVQTVWAVVFATAIEVNIVRLFFEAKLDSDTGAKWLGIVLAIVAGAALLIEGLQQSIGFSWSNVYVQSVIGTVIGLRVLVVVLLMAREGSKLASALSISEQPMYYACLVHFDAPVQPEREQEVIQQSVPITDPQLHIVPDQKSVPVRRTLAQSTEHRIRAIMNTDPNISVRKLAQQAGVSPSTVQTYKKQLAKEA